MNVEGPTAHCGEKRLRDLVAVRGPDQELRTERQYRGDLTVVEARRLPYRQAHGACRHLHRGLAQLAARRWTVGLCHHGHDLNGAALAETVECLERADRELRRSQKQSALC